MVNQNSAQPYQFGFDGARRFIELLNTNSGKYVPVPGNSIINDIVLVSNENQVMNDLKLFNCTKHFDVENVNISETSFTLVHGVPGCGKTTYILEKVEDGDLVLFPARESAAGFRARFRNLHPNSSKDATLEDGL